jgi:hypothetical protein
MNCFRSFDFFLPCQKMCFCSVMLGRKKEQNVILVYLYEIQNMQFDKKILKKKQNEKIVSHGLRSVSFSIVINFVGLSRLLNDVNIYQ